MNFLNKISAAILNWLKPQARYEAATQTTAKRYIPGSLQDVRMDISKATRKEIMRKARYFEKNSAIARRIASVETDFTVGAAGMVFTPASSDREWNDRAKKYLEKTLSVIDLNTRQTFGSIQQLCAWREQFDGDVFIVKTRGQDNQGRFYPRIEIIEAHLCETPDSEASREGKSVIDGVEVDANRRPTGYWFKASSDSTTFKLVDAKNVIVLCDPERTGQVRGLSSFAAAINYLHQLDDLQQLEFSAVRDGAEKSTFIKTVNGELPDAYNPFKNKFGGEPVVQTQAVSTSATDVQSAIGGRTVALKQNEDVVQFSPVRPTEASRWLWSYLTSCICAAKGVPKMIAFSEWLDGAQGTIARGDYDIAAQNFRAKSEVYAAAFREVIIHVLQFGIVTERELAAPPQDWTTIAHTSPMSVNVDVGRNASAQQADLKLGITTHERIYEARGLDARAEITRQIRFIAFVKKACAEIGKQEGVEIEPAEILGAIIPEQLPQDMPIDQNYEPTKGANQ